MIEYYLLRRKNEKLEIFVILSTFNQPLGQNWENFTTGIRLNRNGYVYRHIKIFFYGPSHKHSNHEIMNKHQTTKQNKEGKQKDISLQLFFMCYMLC